MKSAFLHLSVYIFGVCSALTHGCRPSEYESGAGECCPMCGIGTVVLRECAGDSSTTCRPCIRGTFMSEPNGLIKCFSCKACDETQGLYVSRPCTTMSNTVCEVLDGYHCKDYSPSECTLAVKHRQCEPGQKIKTPGTKNSDTVCEACPPGFYSPLGVNCTKWTDCSIKNEIESKEGSSVEDVQCKPTSRERLIVLIVVAAVLVLCFLCIATFCLKQKTNTVPSEKSTRSSRNGNHTDMPLTNPIEETDPQNPSSSNLLEENSEREVIQPQSGLQQV